MNETATWLMHDANNEDPRVEPLGQSGIMTPTRVLLGKYRLGRLLGEGGMGAVYEAEHLGLGTPVAVKMLNDRFVADPKSQVRFRREARAAAAVRHPNVVAVTDTGTDEEGLPFIVMERLEGESLASVLRRKRVLPYTVASAVATQVLAGLEAAHTRGVMHRDLKPGNIFITQSNDGQYCVKIVDFGISKFTDDCRDGEVTADGALLGTPHFMAPEQARREGKLDHRVDLYAVGVLLYRMTTGRMPYAIDRQASGPLLVRITEAGPTAPRALRPEIPEALQAVILHAMATHPDDRFADATAFRAALHAAVESLAADGAFSSLSSFADADEARAFAHAAANGNGLPAAPQAAPAADSKASTRPARGRLRWWIGGLLLLLVAVIGLASWRVQSARSRHAARQKSALVTRAPLYVGIGREVPKRFRRTAAEPLMRYLRRRLRRPVHLKVVDDYARLTRQLLRGELHVASLSPYAYVKAKRKAPELPLLATPVTAGGLSYEAYILGRAGHAVRRLRDLRGGVFCYVSPESTSGYLYARAVLRRAGLDPELDFKATRFAGDHLAALRALHSGACDGAVAYAHVLFDAERYGMPPESFRILGSTDRIPNGVYCASPALSAERIKALRQALLALKPGSEAARNLFADTAPLLGFQASEDSRYDAVRRLMTKP